MKSTIPQDSIFRGTADGPNGFCRQSDGRYISVKMKDGTAMKIDCLVAAPDWLVEHPDNVNLRVTSTAVNGTTMIDVIKS